MGGVNGVQLRRWTERRSGAQLRRRRRCGHGGRSRRGGRGQRRIKGRGGVEVRLERWRMGSLGRSEGPSQTFVGALNLGLDLR